MNNQEYQANACRICLEDDVASDWNQLLYDSVLTYKDCYYKYTQLEIIEADKFPTWICRNCCNGLEYIDTFISTAIRNDLILRENFNINKDIENDDEIKEEEINFETVVIEEIEIKSETPDSDIKNIYECPTKYLEVDAADRICIAPEKSAQNVYECTTQELNGFPSDGICLTPINAATSLVQTKKIQKRQCKKNPNKRLQTNDESPMYEKKKSKLQNSGNQLTNNEPSLAEKLATKNEQKICCSICSKVMSSRYTSIRHEETHSQNRERNITCDKCGLKFYNKNTLRLHMRTHLENREKRFKCEFCDKAFFNKSASIVHQRIHLGQMLSCMLCTKQYYRQSDLDKHMNSHSAAMITSEVKMKKKYYVACKDCGENVRSTNFKSHMAKHTNEPLFKCSICNKEFFFRKSGIRHIKVVHKKPPLERSSFIIAYKTGRLSHLFLEQNNIIKIKDE